MVSVLLDTATLLYWHQHFDKLTASAKDAIDQASVELSGMISTVSIYELGIKAKKGKLTLFLSIQELTQRLQVSQISLLPPTGEVMLKAVELDWEHRDPFDRIIVATPLTLNVPIITPDNKIRDFYQATIW